MPRRPPVVLVAAFSGGAFVAALALHHKAVGLGSAFTSSGRFGDLIVGGQLTAVGWLQGLVVACLVGVAGSVAGVAIWRWFIRDAGGD